MLVHALAFPSVLQCLNFRAHDRLFNNKKKHVQAPQIKVYFGGGPD